MSKEVDKVALFKSKLKALLAEFEVEIVYEDGEWYGTSSGLGWLEVVIDGQRETLGYGGSVEESDL